MFPSIVGDDSSQRTPRPVGPSPGSFPFRIVNPSTTAAGRLDHEVPARAAGRQDVVGSAHSVSAPDLMHDAIPNKAVVLWDIAAVAGQYPREDDLVVQRRSESPVDVRSPYEAGPVGNVQREILVSEAVAFRRAAGEPPAPSPELPREGDTAGHLELVLHEADEAPDRSSMRVDACGEVVGHHLGTPASAVCPSESRAQLPSINGQLSRQSPRNR